MISHLRIRNDNSDLMITGAPKSLESLPFVKFDR